VHRFAVEVVAGRDHDTGRHAITRRLRRKHVEVGNDRRIDDVDVDRRECLATDGENDLLDAGLAATDREPVALLPEQLATHACDRAVRRVRPEPTRAPESRRAVEVLDEERCLAAIDDARAGDLGRHVGAIEEYRRGRVKDRAGRHPQLDLGRADDLPARVEHEDLDRAGQKRHGVRDRSLALELQDRVVARRQRFAVPTLGQSHVEPRADDIRRLQRAIGILVVTEVDHIVDGIRQCDVGVTAEGRQSEGGDGAAQHGTRGHAAGMCGLRTTAFANDSARTSALPWRLRRGKLPVP